VILWRKRIAEMVHDPLKNGFPKALLFKGSRHVMIRNCTNRCCTRKWSRNTSCHSKWNWPFSLDSNDYELMARSCDGWLLSSDFSC
jgi:hypothetical protein